MAENVKTLSEKFDVYRVVKPSSDLSTLTPSMKEDIITLTIIDH
jgi:hypothetical protein